VYNRSMYSIGTLLLSLHCREMLMAVVLAAFWLLLCCRSIVILLLCFESLLQCRTGIHLIPE